MYIKRGNIHILFQNRSMYTFRYETDTFVCLHWMFPIFTHPSLNCPRLLSLVVFLEAGFLAVVLVWSVVLVSAPLPTKVFLQSNIRFDDLFLIFLDHSLVFIHHKSVKFQWNLKVSIWIDILQFGCENSSLRKRKFTSKNLKHTYGKSIYFLIAWQNFLKEV